MPYDSQSGGYSWTSEYRRQNFTLGSNNGPYFDGYVWNCDDNRSAQLAVDYVISITGQKSNSTLPTKTLSEAGLSGRQAVRKVHHRHHRD